MTKIPFLKPNLVKSASYRTYLDSIDSGNVYSNFGPLNSRLEQRIVDDWFDGVGAATTVANATLGLMIAIANCKRANARYALMPSFTFAATPLAAIWCGLEPYFVDIHEDDFCLDSDLLLETIDELGDEVAVVVPYAAFGTSMDLTVYRTLQEREIPVVVDAAASFGARDGGNQFGKDFPGAVVFSFHATKSFGIGEGGLVYSGVTSEIASMRRASNFGFSEDRVCMAVGLNAKLSEYAAAIGLATLDVFPDKIRERQRVHDLYLSLMRESGLLENGWKAQQVRGVVPFQFMTFLCPPGRSRQEYMEGLGRAHIETRTYFSPPCHNQKQFMQAPVTSLTVTEQVAARVISLPLWEGMTEKEISAVVTGLGGQ